MTSRAARWWQLTALLLVLLPSPVEAACPKAVTAWMQGCSASSGIGFALTECAPDRLTISAPAGEEMLPIEVRADGKGFVQQGRFGLSPLGQFPDWRAEPKARRAALEALRKCVEDTPTQLDVLAASDAPVATTRERAPEHAGRALASLLAGLVLAAAVAVAEISRRDALLATLAAAAAFTVRWAVVGFSFFHQNGQGPMWTTFQGETSMYGAGYAELFSSAARVFPGAPERGVFVANAALGALSVAAAFAAVSIASRSRTLGWIVAAAVGLDPIAARVSGSESYFGPLIACAWVATLGVVVATTSTRRRALVGALAAGAVVAAAARVHPVSWAPLATLAFVPLAARRDRLLERTVLAATTIAVVVLLTSGEGMLGVLHGTIGQQWAKPSSLQPGVSVVVLAGLGALSWLAGGVRYRSLAAAFVACAVVALTFRLKGDNELVSGAYLRLCAPPIVALCAFAYTLPRVGPGLAAACVSAWLVFFPFSVFCAMTPFTDTEETRWAMRWRDEIPLAADVCYVERVDRAILRLPIERPGGPRATRIDASRAWSTDGCTHYYRSALCETTDSQWFCERVEATFRLERVEERRLRAAPSLPWLRYRDPWVKVGLYRVVDGMPRKE